MGRVRSPRVRSAAPPGLLLSASRGGSPPRCAGLSPAQRPGLPLPPWRAMGGGRGGRGGLPGEESVCPGLSPGLWLLPLLPGRLGLPGPGRGQVLACASPLMPRPGAQIPASGGGRETPGPSTRPGPRLLRRAGQPEAGRETEARPGFATCPRAPHPKLKTSWPSSLKPSSSGSQPSSLRRRNPDPSLPPSHPGAQTQALLPQTQESRPKPPPSDPGVQTQTPLPQTQGSRPQPSSLRPRSSGCQLSSLRPRRPGPSSPPSNPGVQALILLPQTQGPS
jgi:hypothetical protein